jgi:phospholipid transport system substrate-binding protein
MLAPIVVLTLLAATPRPLEVVRSGYDNVQETARAPKATLGQLAAAVDRFFDFEELTRRAMGESWSALSPTQRKELAADMRGLLRAYYARKVLGRGDAQVEYGQESLHGDEATVSTVVMVEGVQLLIDYKLYKPARTSGWRIYDMVTNQDSLLESYRSQFRQILETQGFNALLATVKARREQFEGPAASQQPGEPGRARNKKAPARKKSRSGE